MTKDWHVNLVGDLNEDICFPLVAVDHVADWKGDVSCVVGFVLFKDNVAPGLVEVSGCHAGVEGIVEERDKLDIYVFFTFQSFLDSPSCFHFVKRRCSMLVVKA